MYFTIGEISSMVNLSKDTLRYYDDVGILKPHMIDPENGYRYYGQEQVETVTQILEYKGYGFTLEEIRRLLSCNDGDVILGALKERYARLAEQTKLSAQTLERLKNKINLMSKDTTEEKKEVKTVDKKKVLIVDDAAFMRISLAKILTDNGYAILGSTSYKVATDEQGNIVQQEFPGAPDGETAIAMYKTERPDIVLMDITMPGMNGIECTSKLRELDPDAKILMVTGMLNVAIDKREEMIRLSYEAGALGYVAKPISDIKLLSSIAEVLGTTVSADEGADNAKSLSDAQLINSANGILGENG